MEHIHGSGLMAANEAASAPYSALLAVTSALSITERGWRPTYFRERILGQVDGLQAGLNEGKSDLDAAAFLRIEPSVSTGGLIR